MRKTILDLDNKNSRIFFLSQEAYTVIELPPYYKFEKQLSSISKILHGSIINEEELKSAKRNEFVNHIIYGNKDGKYAWRKFQLINPYLYVSLVNTITEKKSWELICQRFKNLQTDESIRCMSIPVLSDKSRKQRASQVSEWIELVERESIRLSLEFEYLFETDVADCYGSIYTHSVAWALHGKRDSKEKRRYSQLLGNRIDYHLQSMSYGQTNGIPEGSQLMDFLAEMVLAYADYELAKKIRKLNIKDDEYSILRYRDDYRIFVKDPNYGELIMKELSDTLAELGMSLNTIKTNKSEKIVIDSIKPDKFKSLKEPEIKVINKNTLRKELLMIYELGIDYPNSGAITKRLTNINNITSNWLLQTQYKELIGILSNIAYKNPKSFPIIAALISKAIKKLDKQNRINILNKLLRKISLLPHTGLLEIWFQRITIKHSLKYNHKEKLCKITDGKKLELFNTEWIKSIKIRRIINTEPVVRQDIIDKLDAIISKKEVDLYATIYS